MFSPRPLKHFPERYPFSLWKPIDSSLRGVSDPFREPYTKSGHLASHTFLRDIIPPRGLPLSKRRFLSRDSICEVFPNLSIALFSQEAFSSLLSGSLLFKRALSTVVLLETNILLDFIRRFPSLQRSFYCCIFGNNTCIFKNNTNLPYC